MNKLLTIVIPTYNMEAYLNQCLDSLIVSNEQLEKIEVLVVNDGSKDTSSAIAHEYEAKYPNTFRVIDKENGNYGSCVNRGLKEAKGKYVKVLDADDWFDTQEFETYIMTLKDLDESVDMVLTPFTTYDENTNSSYVATQPYLPTTKILDFRSCSANDILRYSMHMITYRTQLLRDMDYKQTEGISYTDTEWTHIPQYHVKSFVWIPNKVYCYRVGREGQTMATDVLARNIWKYETICRSLINNAKQYPHNDEYPLAVHFNTEQLIFLASSIYRMFLVLSSASKEDLTHLKEYDNYLKEECPIVYKAVSSLKLKKWAPLPYVSIWRTLGIRIPVDVIRDLYRKIKYGK